MKKVLVLLFCVAVAGCSAKVRHSFISMRSVKHLNLSVDRLDLDEERPTTSSCGYTIQQVVVPNDLAPVGIVFRIYPVKTGPGTLVVQLVSDASGKPGNTLIDEWTVKHDGKENLHSHSLLLRFNRILKPDTYWFRFVDSHTAVNTLTFNFVLVDDEGLIRSLNTT